MPRKLAPYTPKPEDLAWARGAVSLVADNGMIRTSAASYRIDHATKTIRLVSPESPWANPLTLTMHHRHDFVFAVLGWTVEPVIDWETFELPDFPKRREWRMLELCTVHVSFEDWERLELHISEQEHDSGYVQAMEHTRDDARAVYGAIIGLRRDPASAEDDEVLGLEASGGFTPAFLELCRKLQAEGYHFLRLHAEGETYPDLPTYPW